MTELGWRWQALEVIREMENTRASNNVAWMDVLRLTVSHAPQKEVKKLFGMISANDQRINELWQILKSKIPD